MDIMNEGSIDELHRILEDLDTQEDINTTFDTVYTICSMHAGIVCLHPIVLSLASNITGSRTNI